MPVKEESTSGVVSRPSSKPNSRLSLKRSRHSADGRILALRHPAGLAVLYLGWLPLGATPLSRGLSSGAGELDLDPAARAENHRRSKTFPVRHSSHRSRWRAASVSDRHRGRSGAGPRLGWRDGWRPPSRDVHGVVAGLSYSSPVAEEPACAWNRRGEGALGREPITAGTVEPRRR